MLKTCTRCGEAKLLTAFYARKRAKDGRESHCKRCRGEYEDGRKDRPDVKARRRRAHNAWVDRNRPTHNLKCRCYNRGITVDEFRRMRDEQQGRCAICEEPKTDSELNIDHNHETGKVRGLLCMHCNHLLGKAKDDVGILERAAVYLNG